MSAVFGRHNCALHEAEGLPGCALRQQHPYAAYVSVESALGGGGSTSTRLEAADVNARRPCQEDGPSIGVRGDDTIDLDSTDVAHVPKGLHVGML